MVTYRFKDGDTFYVDDESREYDYEGTYCSVYGTGQENYLSNAREILNGMTESMNNILLTIKWIEHPHLFKAKIADAHKEQLEWMKESKLKEIQALQAELDALK